MISADDYLAPEPRCVRFLPQTAGWPSHELVAEHNILTVEIDGAELQTENELFDALADAFSFPDYFGFNWDAVYDCLGDLAWLPAAGYVLRVRSGTHLWCHVPALAGHLVEIWLAAAASWANRDTPFFLVFAL